MCQPRSFSRYPLAFMLALLGALLTAWAPKQSTAAESTYPKKLYQALKWRDIGPYRGGRSIAVAGNAATPDTFYFGATGGGVWKTTDSGIHWKNVSDQDFKTGVVGAVAVAPSDPNVVYAGMGESAIRGDMATGNGIYKSTDAGKTWSHVGLTKTHVISDIVVDPKNPDVVYVAALGHVFGPNKTRGVFRSRDGGKTWRKILYKNAKTGAIDIAMDPHNPRILYAALWQAYRRPWMLSSGGPGSGLYKSTDGGDTWKNISQNPGMPKGTLGKIGVSVSGADPDRVYAIIEAKSGGVFRSDDAGKTWQRLYHKSHLTQRAWYFSRIYADPKNENVVYAPQVEGLFKSTDGGKSFTPLDTPHGDNHRLWIDPRDPDTMIGGNDGGASVSHNGGKSWSSEDNQPTAQFYHAKLSAKFPYHIYGAQQDNTTVEIKSRTDGYGITNKDWWPVAGGESGYVVPVPGKPWITYGGGYDGALERYNRRTRERKFIDVWPNNPMGHAARNLKERFQWTFPILVSEHNPHTLYVGSQYVYKSTDDGMRWQRISPDLTRNDEAKQKSSGGPITQDNTSVEYYDTVFALAESPVKAGVLWAGSDDGLVHVSKDGGKHWQDVTPAGLAKWATVSIIDPSHFDAGTAFIAVQRYRLDDFHPYLYKTSDYGAHWSKITNDLPDNEYTFVIRQDTQDKNLLFAGTQRGVYFSTEAGGHWQPLQLNLPHVPIYDMAVAARQSNLVVATHGRAFWILDDLAPLRELAKAKHAGTYLYKPQRTWLTHGQHLSAAKAKHAAIGENPANGVTVYYVLKHAPHKGQEVKLIFMDANGKTIRSFSNTTTGAGKPVKPPKEFYPPKKPRQPDVLPTQTGMNKFTWNLRYPRATNVKGAVLWFGNRKGPQVVPGKYKVRLTVGGHSQTRRFVVAKDPRNSASHADLQARFKLLKRIHAKLNRTNQAINQLRRVRDQLKNYVKRVKGASQAGKIKAMAGSIEDKLNAIEKRLIQTESHAPEDPLNYPIRLNNKLAALAGEIEQSYSRPTQPDHAVFQQVSTKVDKQLAALKQALQHRVPAFNAKVKKLNLPAVYIGQGNAEHNQT